MWYYAEAGQQKGPIDESELDTLYTSGAITPETLVWTEGMANWQTYRDARQASGSTAPPPADAATSDGVVCVECGKIFPQNEVIKYGDAAVCANCKPVFVQRLKEGVNQAVALNYGGFWIRFVAKFLALILLWIVNIVVQGAIIAAGGKRTDLTFIIVAQSCGFLIQMAYVTLFVGAYGATPGKMVAKLRIVNVDGTKIGYGKALGRYFAEIVSGFTCGIGYIMVGFDDEKRALHDRICNTRVVKI